MAESAAITVQIDTAPIQAMIDELRTAQFWTRSQIEDLQHWAWRQGYDSGHKDATNGKEPDSLAGNPHKPLVHQWMS